MKRITLLAVTAIILAGCTAPGSQLELTDLHAMVVEPDGTLLLATHDGLIEATDEDGWKLAVRGAAGNDLMGLSRGADGTLWGGGHPQVTKPSDPKHLGLFRSQDDGVSWESVSLHGQADFHALTTLPSGDVLAWSQGLASWDGSEWMARNAPSPVASLTNADGVVFAGTMEGIWSSTNGDQWTPVGTLDRPVASIAVSDDAMLAHVREGRTGDGLRSTDGGQTWQRIDHDVLGTEPWVLVFAFDPNDGQHVFAGRYGGVVYESVDAGASWTRIIG